MQLISRILLVMIIACSVGLSLADTPKEPGVMHVVLVWLKEPGNAEHRQRVIDGSKKLKEIPGVLDLRVGEVVTSDREVVDSSYDVALYLRFGSQQALQSYLVHPIHKNTVRDEFVPVMDYYRVYDFTDE